MKAIVSHLPGRAATLVLEDVPAPGLRPGHVRVAVHASGVNFPDVLMIRDAYQVRPPRPFSPGIEIAGTIEALADDVTGFRVGDRVAAVVPCGGLAELALVPAADLVALPEDIGFVQAAAMLVTDGTAFHALRRRADLRPGETLFVTGAAGGVGSAAIRVGKALGARVVGAASDADKAEVARRAGADETLVYPRGPLDAAAARDLKDAIRRACGPEGWNVACDPVGGDYVEPALRAGAWGSRYLVVGFTAGIPQVPLNLVLLKESQILGVLWGEAWKKEAAQSREDLGALLRLVSGGRVAPPAVTEYRLEEAPQALAALEARHATGKLVVRLR